MGDFTEKEGVIVRLENRKVYVGLITILFGNKL